MAAQCQYCGKDCGNEGARTNHERACPENPANQGTQNRATPARREPKPSETRPVRQSESASAGGTLADALIAVSDDDAPLEARQKAVKDGLGIIGDAIARYQSYREKKMQQQEMRAESAELEEVVEYPVCECGYQFGPEEIGINNTQVRCPECRKLWEIKDVEGEAT